PKLHNRQCGEPFQKVSYQSPFLEPRVMPGPKKTGGLGRFHSSSFEARRKSGGALFLTDLFPMFLLIGGSGFLRLPPNEKSCDTDNDKKADADNIGSVANHWRAIAS